MKHTILYFLFGALLYSGESYSQTINTKELLGKWQMKSADYIVVMLFENDSILTELKEYSKDEKNKQFLYTLTDSNNSTILSFTPKDGPDKFNFYRLKLNKINQDSIAMTLFGMEMYDIGNKRGIPIPIPPGADTIFIPLKREK